MNLSTMTIQDLIDAAYPHYSDSIRDCMKQRAFAGNMTLNEIHGMVDDARENAENAKPQESTHAED